MKTGINLEGAGVINLDFAIFKDAAALKVSQLGKFRNLKISAVKGIKVKISPENTKTMKFFQEACESNFYKKIVEKYNVSKRSSKVSSNLTFFKFTATNYLLINVRNLKSVDNYIIPHFNLIFNFVEERKIGISNGIYPDSNVPSSLEYLHWKRSNVSGSLLKSKGYANIPYFINCNQKQKKSNSGVIYPQTPVPKAVSGLLYSRNESNNEGWKIGKSGVPGFWHSESGRRGSTSFHHISLPQASLEDSWFLQNIRIDIPDIRNPPCLSCRIGSLSKNFKVTTGKTLNTKSVSFLGNIRLSDQKADFLIERLHHRQRSSKPALKAYEDTEVEKSVQHRLPFPQKSIVLEYASLWNEDVAVGQVTVEDAEDAIIGNRQDIILRKPVRHISKEISRSFEKDEAENTSKNNIHISSKKSNFSIVSPAEVNTIADKVYKLLEAKLLIEKERRGLR